MTTTSRGERGDIVRPAFKPRIIIHLKDIDHVDEARARLEEAFPRAAPLTVEPLYTITREQLDELVERARVRNPDYRPPNWLAQFTVDTPNERTSADFARRVLRLDFVERAYPDVEAGDPSAVSAFDDPHRPDQAYLDPADVGIGVDAAWRTPGGDGRGQHFIDIEQGWTRNHDDLSQHNVGLLGGLVDPLSRPHGTAVLGIVCAYDNSIGTIGIAPHVSGVSVISHNGSLSNVPNAITTAALSLDCGEVLLLEVQTQGIDASPPGAPAELLHAVYQQIELATTAGVVVVEAAGNEEHPLDELDDDIGDAVFKLTVRDSGAIMVGAATAGVPHQRTGSCHGERVDCYAWGEDVYTTSSTDTGATDEYTAHFNGTSAASAIIAGVVLAVQGAYWHAHQQRLSPIEMRALLRDAALGTATGGVDGIGSMPDLEKLIPEALQRVPGGCGDSP